mmetsp:Transcript_14427/g.23489  ORF Transcript_14427/g.23489 Transcript_14427/m.23489 type:complete len:189 (+) Transcript_14427:269-835(+)
MQAILPVQVGPAVIICMDKLVRKRPVDMLLSNFELFNIITADYNLLSLVNIAGKCCDNPLILARFTSKKLARDLTSSLFHLINEMLDFDVFKGGIDELLATIVARRGGLLRRLRTLLHVPGSTKNQPTGLSKTNSNFYRDKWPPRLNRLCIIYSRLPERELPRPLRTPPPSEPGLSRRRTGERERLRE